MRKERKDIVGSKYVRNENGTLKVKEEEVMERWRSFFSFLLNKANNGGSSSEKHESRQAIGP